MHNSNLRETLNEATILIGDHSSHINEPGLECNDFTLIAWLSLVLLRQRQESNSQVGCDQCGQKKNRDEVIE